MKKIMSKWFVLLGITVVLMSMSGTVFAAGTVTYDGNAKDFIFAPGSEYSPTDLFTDFKNIMPGESITQKVFVKNDISKDVKIKIYMRSLGAQEGSEDFLAKLRLKVSQEGDSILFDAPADQTAQLTDWVCLGTFYSGAEIDLNVTLEVPIELGNEYQDAIGYLDWQFKVEEFPVEPGDPQTGDAANTYFYIAIASASGLALILLLAFKCRKTQR